MPTRLEVLEQLAAKATNDPFPMYGLALEYRSNGRPDDALKAFESLHARFPAYVPQYLMAGQLCETQGRRDEARTWYTRGVEAAKNGRDAHALGELESALAGVA